MKKCDLVLEGGGVKGIGLVGAYTALVENGYQVNKVAGTSAGAIVGSLIAAGTPPEHLLQIMADVNWRHFRDTGFVGRTMPPLEVAWRKGWFRGDYLHGWVQEHLASQGVRTFKDLRVMDPLSSISAPQYKFVAMTSDITRGKLVRLPWDYPLYGRNADDVLVADAVRASASIPLYFRPAKQPGGEWWVDGGVLSNFPVDTFDRTDDREPRWPTFGIRLSGHKPNVNNVDGVFSMAKALVQTVTGFYDAMHIEAAADRTIFVDNLGVGPLDFGLTRSTAMRLYESGRWAATRFLSSFDFEDHLEERAARPRRDPTPRR